MSFTLGKLHTWREQWRPHLQDTLRIIFATIVASHVERAVAPPFARHLAHNLCNNCCHSHLESSHVEGGTAPPRQDTLRIIFATMVASTLGQRHTRNTHVHTVRQQKRYSKRFLMYAVLAQNLLHAACMQKRAPGPGSVSSAVRSLHPQLGFRYNPEMGSCKDEVVSDFVAKCKMPVPERIHRNSSHSAAAGGLCFLLRGTSGVDSSVGSSELEGSSDLLLDASPLHDERGGACSTKDAGAPGMESDIAKGNLGCSLAGAMSGKSPLRCKKDCCCTGMRPPRPWAVDGTHPVRSLRHTCS